MSVKLNVGWVKNFATEKVDEPDMPSLNYVAFNFMGCVNLK